MAKEKEARRPFNLKKEVKLLPGYIILLLWVIFTIALLGWVFGASFSTTAEIFQGKALKFESGLHFENYAKAWNGAGVAGFFGNSLIYSVISCTILILVCAPAAYVLSRFDFKCNKFLLLFIMLGMMVPVHTVLVPVSYIIGALNLKNNIPALVMIYVAFSLPFSILVVTNFMKGVNRSLEEAALIDGATYFQIYKNVMLPMTVPAISTISIFNFLGAWNNILFPLLFINDKNLKPIALGLLNFNGERGSDYGPLMAAIVITVAVPLVIYLLFQEKVEGGLAAGAVKE